MSARRILDKSLFALKRACLEFVDDRGHRDAAQIAFFATLSFVPLAMLLVGGFGLFFDDEEIRERVVRVIFDNVPLSQESDRGRLERTVDDALDNTGQLGPISIVLLIVAASGVMGALRHAINEAWDIHTRPPIVRRKLLDLSLVLGSAAFVVFCLSISATRETADDLEDTGWILDLVGDALPFIFSVLVVLFLYRVLPSPRPKTREIWPGAVVAALLISLTRGALELYFEHLADFGALYGSLGALMALLIFIYAVSLILVFGAEYASEWSRVPKPPADDDR
ncbi:YihY/virulence factor BrkB family protein [Solirubrobacter sp. CPCC 204708]|uniref:YihY/virulence factor BrkB family protein n=1 Tax=Solirubrobacter deserti TaxID=2282478 RepID=A0ABT4RGQ2_9ACTN|nr:YihY/virulence factor BrkB family protein [Solirubrobacter deserti]MBE2318204.1 YihY/virulence factor BrkB family protein [Solirubrobacter deserti]MDA0137485.1 YihY/virulence factor BrkB family protein [Solirubrobacter deserti]